jgi:nucleotide-binding universal stress UspA family protein
VLVVNADRPDPYRHVLAAIDLSECSGHALETAWQTGLVAGTQLTALHVCDPAEGMQRPDPHADAEGKRAAAMLEASRALAAFLDGLSLAGAAYALRVRTEDGPAGAAISRAAAELQADLVVAGRRGRNRVVRMLLGSVTDDLLTLLDTDILVVPCPANA